MRRLLVVLLVLALSPSVSGRVCAQDDEARRILRKAIQAHGGAERLARVKSGYTKTSGVLFQFVEKGVPFEQEAWFEEPDRVRSVMKISVIDKTSTIVTVLNGPKGWISVNGETKEMDDNALSRAKEELYLAGVHRLVALADKPYQLSFAGEVPEGPDDKRPMVGIRVESPGHGKVFLHFDKEKGLLVQTTRQVNDPMMPGTELTESKVLTGYKNVDGVQSATLVSVFRRRPGMRDWLPVIRTDVLKVEFPERFAEKCFDRP